MTPYCVRMLDSLLDDPSSPATADAGELARSKVALRGIS